MSGAHAALVQQLLSDGETEHAELLARLPAAVAALLPVDAQGLTRAIEHLAQALGFSARQRLSLVAPHAVNPAVLHARVFGAAQLSVDTVLGAFVEGARVRAEALLTLARAAGDEQLLGGVQALLIDHPLPAPAHERDGGDPEAELRQAYAAQERAALLIAQRLDRPPAGGGAQA